MPKQLNLSSQSKEKPVTSSIISMPFTEPSLRPVNLLKSSQQITSNRQTKTLEGAIARPYNVDDLKATLEANVWHNRCIQFKATCSVGLGFNVWKKGDKVGVDDPYEEDELQGIHPCLFQAMRSGGQMAKKETIVVRFRTDRFFLNIPTRLPG